MDHCLCFINCYQFVYLATTIFVRSYYGMRGCHGHDRMAVGFTTTCAISAYHH